MQSARGAVAYYVGGSKAVMPTYIMHFQPCGAWQIVTESTAPEFVRKIFNTSKYLYQ